MLQFGEGGSGQQATPGREVVIDGIAVFGPAFLVVAARVRAKQHTVRLERRMQLPEDAWQFLARDVKQRRIGEYSVEVGRG